MVNKLLIGVGIVVLVAVGSIGVWKLGSGGEDRRVGALGPLGDPIPLAWRGTWIKDAKYAVGEVVSYGDSSYVAEADNSAEPPDAKEGPWALMAAQGPRGLQGAQGPAGAFSGTFQSPNGSYSLVVADDGIVMQGPPGTIKLRDTGVELMISKKVSIKAGQTLTLDATGNATLKGAGTLTVQAAGVLYLKGSLIQQN
jgi:hypothetical protein